MLSIYFLPWVVLILAAVIAIPIAMKMEGRKSVSYDDGESPAEDEAEVMTEEEVVEQGAEVIQDAAGFGDVQPAAVDDFAELG